MLFIRTLVGFLVVIPAVRAGDWPQWLGPARNGSSPETVFAWRAPPRRVWAQSVGEGHSSPVVSNGHVFLLAKVAEKEEEELTAFDAAAGNVLWRFRYERGEFRSIFGNGPRSTPIVSGSRVYCFGATGVLTCVDAASGRQVWQLNTTVKFRAPQLFFGASCSPLLHQGKIFLNIGAKNASIIAVDAQTGQLCWQALDDGAGYASPIVVPGHDQIIFLTAQGLISVKPENGSLNWHFPFADLLGEASATPTLAGDALVASTITLGAVALRVDGTRSGTEPAKLWAKPEFTSYFSTPVPAGGYLYMVTGTKPPALQVEATLRCTDPRTGRELWHKANVGKYHASLLRTGNDKLLLLQDSGRLAFIDPSPEACRELAAAQVCGETWAHPALANGRLYIRDQNRLICLELQP
jgi:outer membrane protein assembly factor BamB